jgi:hypothetical protein
VDKNFRQVAAERAIKKAINDSISIARERCPKTALGFAHRSRVSNQYGDFSGDHRRDFAGRHPNRQPSGISRKQLSSLFDYSLEIHGLEEHRSVNQERGFIEFWHF